MLLNSTKRGIIITWPGSIMVTTISTNQILRPLNLIRARPKATIAEEAIMPTADRSATKSEFEKKVVNV